MIISNNVNLLPSFLSLFIYLILKQTLVYKYFNSNFARIACSDIWL